ncbi:glycosyltransferase family 2 protein [Leptospira sp. GIMC2001]|uniref:glycosyltransferase family 2 protein n=1 Tax=Leptospira sp. GIMC2001 TaxID=1513297 RepID=UPI00234B194F|nr:glycosyltransferase family 2 protein [Leptospira sp. GIMC2001]WCL51275.1 glycosyltransferase family 2 protein [Leptospira sp. GIMC2001]
MKISIITPTFNEEKHIEKCINSIAVQTFKDYEHLIIDNKSTDNTANIVKSYQKRNNRIKFISKADKGIYDAMNYGLKLAKGDWVYFLGADDRLLSKSIFSKIFLSDLINNFDFLYGDVQWGDSGRFYDGKFTESKLFQRNICHQAIFVKRNILLKLGSFDTSYKVLADWIVNFKCFADDKIRKNYIGMPIAYYSLNGLSSNSDDEQFLADRNEIFKKYLSTELIELLDKNKDLENKLEEMRTSASFRIGSYLLNPYKILTFLYFFGYKKHTKKYKLESKN